jgi:hypothetical protein
MVVVVVVGLVIGAKAGLVQALTWLEQSLI